MQLTDPLSEYYATEFDESWERERTATPIRVFAVRLHATVVRSESHKHFFRLIGVERFHQESGSVGASIG